MIALLAVLGLKAQTMNIVVGSVTYAVPAEIAGDMVYNDSHDSLTVLNKTIAISDITNIYVDSTTVTDASVNVSYSGTAAAVVVSGDIMQYLTTTVSNANVSCVQSSDLASEITYTLSGTSTDGSFYMDGEYKATVVLSDLTLTRSSASNAVASDNIGYAINIDNGKRINVQLDGTNTLTDYASGAQKGCLMINGHSEFSGSGTLNVYGNYKHGVWTDEYLMTKKSFTGTINVLSAAKDGLNINQYLEHRAGTISVSGTGDDGIQVGATGDEGDENDGQIIIGGGTINVTITAEDVKGIKSDSLITINSDYSTPEINIAIASTSHASKGIKSGGNMDISAGTFNISSAAYGVWDSEDSETSACAGIKSAGTLNISGGTFTLSATGSGGKGIACDSDMNISGGTFTITTSGNIFYSNGKTTNTNYTSDADNVSSDYTSSPKGIKVDGNLNISGGTITVNTTGVGGEGIECKGDMTISGGVIMSTSAHDDAINSGISDEGTGDMTITGGYVYGVSAGNDGLDANGNLYIKGGVVYAACCGGAEVALDANTEMKNQLYITGGTVITFGGIESGASVSTSYISTTASANTNYALLSGTTVLAAWKSPTNSYSYSSMAIYSSDITSGSSYSLNKGCTLSGTSYFDGYYYEDATVSGGSTSTVSTSSSSSGGSTPGTPGSSGGSGNQGPFGHR